MYSILWQRLFKVGNGNRIFFKTILWWELRRIPYNIIIGLFGIINYFLLYLFITLSGELQSGEDIVEPIALIMAPIIANIFYTMGWIVEIIINFLFKKNTRPIGPIILKMGLAFSLFVMVIPIIFWGIYCLLGIIN